MRDQIAEMLSIFEGLQDDGAQCSAEIDESIEENPAHPNLNDMSETQTFLSERFAFNENVIAWILAGSPVLLGH